MSVEKRPEPELPFRPKEQPASRAVEFSEILTGETKTFDFGSKERDGFSDLHLIDWQCELTDEENNCPVILQFKKYGALYYSSGSIGRQTIKKIRDGISLELIKKIWNQKNLTEKEITLVEEGEL